MNGIYWATGIPRLFNIEDISDKSFRIQTIADITDDHNGSVPCNIGDGTIEDPVYGVNKQTFERTLPYEPGSVDIMAVSNLPNELPRDASRYFGEQLINSYWKILSKEVQTSSGGRLWLRMEYSPPSSLTCRSTPVKIKPGLK
jgi:hypothetical protein